MYSIADSIGLSQVITCSSIPLNPRVPSCFWDDKELACSITQLVEAGVTPRYAFEIIRLSDFTLQFFSAVPPIYSS